MGATLAAAQFGVGLVDEARATRQQHYLNQLHEQGREQLQALASETRPQLNAVNDQYYQAENQNARDTSNAHYGNLSQLTRQMYGVSTPTRGAPGDVTGAKSIPEAQSWLENGGRPLSGQEQAAGTLGNVADPSKSAFSKVVDENSKKYLDDMLEMRLGPDQKTMLQTANDDANAVLAEIKSNKEYLTAEYTKINDEIKDQSAYAVRSAAAPMVQTMNQTVAQLSSQLTGNPEQDAMIQKDIAAVKAKYTGAAVDKVREAGLEMNNFAATVRQNAFSTLSTKLSAGEQTMQQALGVKDRLFADWGNMMAQAQTNVFNMKNAAGDADINMFMSLNKEFGAIDDAYAANQHQINTNFASMATAAVLNETQLRGQAAASYIDASVEFVPWATAFGNYFDEQMQMDQMAMQQDAYDKAFGLGVAQTALSPFNVGVNIPVGGGYNAVGAGTGGGSRVGI